MLVTFDQFKIDSDQGVFLKDGSKLDLRPKELAVLCLLVNHAGELVTKKQIIDEVWQGFPTSDESIARCISIIKTRLRTASPDNRQFINTEYGRGYRFIGNVSTVLDRRSQKHHKKTSLKPTTLGEIATQNILCCPPDTSVREAARLISSNNTSSILILADQKPLGIWTESDALSLDLNDPNIFNIKMAEVMHSPVISLTEWQPITEAVALMRDKAIRHLIVVDAKGNAAGMVTQSDIMYSHGIEAFLTVKNVKAVAYRKPHIIHDNLPVAQVFEQMRKEHADLFIIHIENQGVFSFTEHDALELVANGHIDTMIGNIELKKLVTININTSLLVARQLMDIKRIKHLAVIDEQGDIIKTLSLSDILAELELSYMHLMEEIIEQNSRMGSSNEENAQLFTQAIEQTAGMIIITDQYGDIEYVNEAFTKISGYQLDEVKGSNPRFLKAERIPKSAFRSLWDTIKEGNTWKGELCNKKKSGEPYWVLCSVSPMFNENKEIQHYIAVEEDITERKKVELRLREIEERFYEMVHHGPVMIWEAESNGKVHFLTKYWLEFTGREINNQLGNGWAEQLHPDDLENFIEIFQKSLLMRSSFSLDHRLKNAIGEYRWVMNSGMPRFNDDGDFLGFRGSCVDITERKIREIEALKLAYNHGQQSNRSAEDPQTK